MTIEELKQAIEQQTGVPAALLNGETAEENIAQAKAVLAYRKEQEAQRTRTTSEQFGEWFNAIQGIEEQDAAGAALEALAEAARPQTGYPSVPDHGNILANGAKLPDPRPTREKFKEWATGQLFKNPFEDNGGWL